VISQPFPSTQSQGHAPQSDLPYKPTPLTLAAKPTSTNETAGTTLRGNSVKSLHPRARRRISILCVARCVRRPWFCGFDEYLEKSFEHQKPWVEQHILELGGIFACGIYAYAIMSNHYHLVVHMSPSSANDSRAYEVARRWVKLYPTGKSDTDQLKVEAIVVNEIMIKIYRQRLTDLSWLMKSISEPIARRANVEDKVNSRFWQG